jgi:hypothetical protein
MNYYRVRLFGKDLTDGENYNYECICKNYDDAYNIGCELIYNRVELIMDFISDENKNKYIYI